MDGFVETFAGGLNPSYVVGSFLGPTSTPYGAGAVRLYESGGLANGFWVNAAPRVDPHVGLTNPAYRLDQSISVVEIVQARITPPASCRSDFPICTVFVGQDLGYDAETGDAACVVFSRTEAGVIKASLSVSPAGGWGDAPVVVVGGAEEIWLGGLWLSYKCTDTEVIAELWDHDPVFGGIALAAHAQPRVGGLVGPNPSAVGLWLQQVDETTQIPLLVSQWSYRPITPPPPPTVKVTGGQRGQIWLG